MFGIFASVASSVFGGLQQRKQVEAQNAALKAQFEMNKSITQESLSTLSYRVSQAESDIIRDRVRRNVATKKAIKKATGESAVAAAQIGAAGRRVNLGLQQARKEGANIISDNNVNAQTELINLTNQLNDRAAQMVQNLNNARPVYGEPPSTAELLIDAGLSAANTYANMSPGAKEELGSSFKRISKPDYYTINTTGPEFNIHGYSAGAQLLG